MLMLVRRVVDPMQQRVPSADSPGTPDSQISKHEPRNPGRDPAARGEPISSMSGARERDLPLEGVRGLCAMLVIFGHMTYQAPLLDPGYACDLLHVDYGPQAVFVFFIISGYVIGLTSSGPATGPAVRNYCSRRLLRIVPIAWTAILLTWVLLRRNDLAAVVGNLLFLQNYQPYPFGFHVPVLYDNPPLWSLSFEMLYYALFVVVWRHPGKLRAVFGITMLVAFSDLLGVPPIFTRYAAYFVFWLVGLALAWHSKAPEAGANSPWPSAFCAAFVTWSVQPIHSILATLSLRLAGLDSDRFHADALLGSVLIVLSVTRRSPALCRRLIALAAVLGVVVLPLRYLDASLSSLEFLGAALLCIAFLGRNRRPGLGPLAALAPVGLVSYALYATAYPLMRIVYRSPFLPSGSAGTFFLRAMIYFVMCGTAAYLLERVLQPRWVRMLSPFLGLRAKPGPETPPNPAQGS
jgi:peptidoglycan/LPS O-acetylase OafA/YrhL